MNFFLATVAYLVIGAVLVWGLIAGMNGNWWVFIVALLAYIIAFGKIGCLPKKSSH